MNNQPENPPAFPVALMEDNGRGYGDKHKVEYSGMTLRDYFAGLQLAGACANPNYKGEVTQAMADAAYRHADAMLRARKEPSHE